MAHIRTFATNEEVWRWLRPMWERQSVMEALLSTSICVDPNIHLWTTTSERDRRRSREPHSLTCKNPPTSPPNITGSIYTLLPIGDENNDLKSRPRSEGTNVIGHPPTRYVARRFGSCASTISLQQFRGYWPVWDLHPTLYIESRL